VERVDKPWGHELIFAKTDSYIGKVLFIRKGHKLSLQYHEEKEETIFLQEGDMMFTVEEDGALVQKRLSAGDQYHIVPNVKHRMEAMEDCTIFEVSTTQLDDVVRLEDAYGRAGT
jgi:quercetin dioxygenase-like cupin family protein